MFILAGKLLLWFSFVFMYLIKTITLSQTDFIYYVCSNSGNFTTNSTYQRNLATTLSALPSTNSGFGFFNRSTGDQGTDRVNSIALCRGDVNPDVCMSCLNDSIVKLREVCPNQKEAIGYYDYCLLRYSNETILGRTETSGKLFLLNTQNVSDRDGFNRARRPLMNQLTLDAAGGGPLLKFATGNTTTRDFTRIYGLVQCTPDVTQGECTRCLEDSINQFVVSYGMAIGGQSLHPMCKFRYEVYHYYNGSTLVIPPPPSSAPPPPILQPVPPPPLQEK